MANSAPYEGSMVEEKAVFFGFPKTYAVQPTHFPVTGWQLAAMLNAAYSRGYQQAQSDVRSALGLKMG